MMMLVDILEMISVNYQEMFGFSRLISNLLNMTGSDCWIAKKRKNTYFILGNFNGNIPSKNGILPLCYICL